MNKAKANDAKNGKASTGARAPGPWPNKPEKHKRMPLVAAFLDADEFHGVLVDVEKAENERGESVDALVFLASMPTKARTTYGQSIEVGVNQPVHVASPAMLKLAPLASDPEKAFPCIVYRQVVNGRSFFAVDVREEPIAREALKPEKLSLPAA